VKNRFNSTLRRILSANAHDGQGHATSAKRRRVESAWFANDCDRSPSCASGKSQNSSDTAARLDPTVCSRDKNGAIVGLEQLVAASLQVEKRVRVEGNRGESETEDDAEASGRAPVPKAEGEESVRGAKLFADHASHLAGLQLQQQHMQLQQQLKHLAAAAYPAFHGAINQMSQTTQNGARDHTAMGGPPGQGLGSHTSPAEQGNAFMQALQAQLATEHRFASHAGFPYGLGVTSAYGNGDLVVARAILAAQQMAAWNAHHTATR
jgi:hypothetical protein